ncbi:MAG: GntR family transcriptional regulator [Bacteroidota bacterium]|nr:GntR family transcriptional regulator [Bacteroidota bacterium]MDP4195288.1 GntR family transcriptional regulator [Bacteroidota bacterium]
MKIDRNSALPLYYQLKEILKEEIDLGKYKPGDQIPSENELATILNISRNTAKEAIATLVSEGILYRIQGKGTFVSEKKIFNSLKEDFSFSSEFKTSGPGLVTKVIFAEEIPEVPEMLDYLKLKESTELFRIQRLRMFDNVPFALQTSYIPKFFCPNLLSFNLEERPLFEILKENFEIKFGYFTERLTCVKADKYEAGLLRVKKNEPLFFLTRKTYTQSDEIIEVVRSFMPGDRCEFSFNCGEQVSIELNQKSIQELGCL